MIGIRINIRGIVQGVGFRPFIYNLAKSRNLRGWVLNSSNGVEIEAIGEETAIHTFLNEITSKKPPLARLDEIKTSYFSPETFYQNFEIRTSESTPTDFIPISPDIAICDDCRRELFDPSDRRYRYPFINCTNCGPRFTIIKDIPYDRPFTTMADFMMCPRCREEYENPSDRRFHAQPIACPECGPRIWFESNGIRLAENNEAILIARQWLKAGKIIAIKGLGGYHLACDAENHDAVELLRHRKKRILKPFALMSYSIELIQKHCSVTPDEFNLLNHIVKPIVLLTKNNHSTISKAVAPGQNVYGFMLPYTPLHLLLLEPMDGFPEVFVMTSGNISEEPISYKDDDARLRLSSLADGFLMHNRDIHTRLDDSVVRLNSSRIYPIRRSRGYAPDPIILNKSLNQIFAAGADLKNTFCLTRGRYAFLSHHIGDLENYSTFKAYEENIIHYQKLFRINPEIIACDLHPEYYSTKHALSLASSNKNLTLIQVQHHHAHLAACLADNQWSSNDPVICFSFDGTGYGTDGAIWGGEVLVGGYLGFDRKYHLQYFSLPGGDMAIRNSAKTSLSLLWSAGLPWLNSLPPFLSLSKTEIQFLRLQLEKNINCIPTSSMGRLFDAISALLNICEYSTYEGQAAMELEAACNPSIESHYNFDIQNDTFSPLPLLAELLDDLQKNVPVSIISTKFHNGIANLVLQISLLIRNSTGLNHVALSGGVWQNMYLFNKVFSVLTANQFNVLFHHLVPTNDGGIALGQALIANEFVESSKNGIH